MTERSDIGNYQPLTYFQLMEVSLRELLVEKGIVSEQAVSDAVEDMRRRGPDTGARTFRLPNTGSNWIISHSARRCGHAA